MSATPSRAMHGTIAGACVLLAAAAGSVGGGTPAARVAHAAPPARAQAQVPRNLPYMCFTTNGTFHQIFGPDSFDINEDQQGPAGFHESPLSPHPTVTLPLYRGTAAGHAAYYVITDASNQALARTLGVNYTPKLANALGSRAVQASTSNNPRAINVPGDVDFSPVHVITPSATGFPPATDVAGANGRNGYTPLVQITFRGARVVINAPQLGDGRSTNGADKRHWADKVVRVNLARGTVTYSETNGCYEEQSVHYVSFDSSDPGASGIEDVTYSAALGTVPSADCAAHDLDVNESGHSYIAPHCAREGLIAFINGQTGTGNPQRQGLNAAILNGEAPLNILEDAPNKGARFNYSPMWDIHIVRWDASVPIAQRTRQTDFADTAALVGKKVQSLGPKGWGKVLRSTGFVVNCPLISMFAKSTGRG